MKIFIFLVLLDVLNSSEQQSTMVIGERLSQSLWADLDNQLGNLYKKQDYLRQEIVKLGRMLREEGVNISTENDDYIDPFGYGILSRATHDVSLLKLIYNQDSTSNNSTNAQTENVEYCTPPSGGYTFFRVSGNEFKFRVRTDKDAYIGLSRAPNSSHPFYRVVLGGWGNTLSVIQYNDANTGAEVKIQGIVNDCQYRGFWIRWDNETITVGYEESRMPFLTHNHAGQLYKVNYIGLQTGVGATGNWLFNRET